MRVGPYVATHELGRGAFGVVLAAVDPATGRELAIKLLTVDHPDARQRLLREGEALGRLRHEGIVAVLAAGQDGHCLWLAMERVQGRSLQARLDREGPLACDEVRRLGVVLARALEHAHARGVVHRDIKPDNVLLPDDGGPPKLVDFGLATELDDAERLTRTGALLGTPHFWSPEQATGERRRVGPASDLYSLGGTLYAALTGRPPNDGATLQEVLDATVRRPVTPPSRLRPGVDRALERVVVRCLAKRPEERYPSASALAEALTATTTAPESAGRARLAAGLASLVLVGVAGALVTRGLPASSSADGGSVGSPTSSQGRPFVEPAAAPPTPAAPRQEVRRAATIEEIPPRPPGVPEWARGDPMFQFVGPDAADDPDGSVAGRLAVEGYERDPTYSASALRWIAEQARSPAKRGDAWWVLAKLFGAGRGVRTSPAERLRCVERAAALGHIDARLALGAEHEALGEVEPALRWLRLVRDDPAASQAQADAARVIIGRLFMTYPSAAPAEEVERTLRQGRDVECRLTLASFLEERGRSDEAEEVLRELVVSRDVAEAHAKLLVLERRRGTGPASLPRGPRDPVARADFLLQVYVAGRKLELEDEAVQALRELARDPGAAGAHAAATLLYVHVHDRRQPAQATRVSDAEAAAYRDRALAAGGAPAQTATQLWEERASDD